MDTVKINENGERLPLPPQMRVEAVKNEKRNSMLTVKQPSMVKERFSDGTVID